MPCVFSIDDTGGGWDVYAGVIVIRTAAEERCSSPAIRCCLSGGLTVTTKPPSSGTSLETTMGGGVSSNAAIGRMGLAGVLLDPPLSPDAISFL